MYYDINSADYIATPSFVIPNTGILTMGFWINSKYVVGFHQAIMGDPFWSTTVGYFRINRQTNSHTFNFQYSNGVSSLTVATESFFTNLNDTWIHIAIICDYNNGTFKVYRNGVQVGATTNLTGTPLFPSSNMAKYIGSYTVGGQVLTDQSLDEVRIYNRGLSADEVSRIYNSTKSRY